jgi:hypothetical protein
MKDAPDLGYFQQQLRAVEALDVLAMQNKPNWD